MHSQTWFFGAKKFLQNMLHIYNRCCHMCNEMGPILPPDKYPIAFPCPQEGVGKNLI